MLLNKHISGRFVRKLGFHANAVAILASISIKLAYILSILLLASCSKPTLFDATVYEFPGVESLSDNGNGTYTLTWEQVPGSEVSYLVYARKENETYNFASPSDKTALAKWTSPNLRFVGNTCYVVRFLKADLAVTDSNKNEKCTNNEVYSFAGAKTASINEDGTIKVSWDKIPDSSVSYEVFLATAAGTYDFTKSLIVTSESAIVINALPLSQKNCYIVRFNLVDAPVDTNKNEVCAALPYIDGFIGVASATSSDTGSATVTWTKPTLGMDEVTGYRVYTGTDFKTQVGSTDGRSSSLTVTGLPPDSVAKLGVRAFDKYGREDSNTRTVDVTIVNNALPNFGGIDTITQASSSSIQFNWAAADIKPSRYNIYKTSGTANSTLAVDTTTPFTTVTSTIYTATINNLGDEQSHCFQVKAETSGGQKDLNSVVKCLTLPDNGAPVFTGLKTLTFSGGGAQLTWDVAIGQTTHYKVYYQQGTSLNFGTASTMTISAPATSANITGLADNRDWTFAVRAVDSHNASDTNSITRTATAGDLTPPTFAGYVSATATGETTMQVVFNRSTDADTDHYNVRVRLAGTTDTFQTVASASQVGSGTVTSNVSNLLPATSYDVLVTVYDTAGNPSTNSSALTRATLDLTAPNFGGVVSAAKKVSDITKMTVNWNAATDPGGLFEYRIYYSTQSLVGKTLLRSASYPLTSGGQTIYMSSSIANTATTFDLSGLTASTTYYFVVHAVDAAGNEDSNTIQASALVPNYTAPAAPTALVFSPVPSSATTNRVPYVNGSAIVGNIAYVYVDGTVAGSQAVSAGGTFSIQLSLPNTSKVYVVTATQKNTDGVESSTASVGNYNLQVTAPTAALSNTPATMTSTAAISVNVGGSNVSNYRWAVISSGGDCTAASYSAITAFTTPITTTIGTDGSWKLCVFGQDNLANEQGTATTTTWTLDTVAPSQAATLTNAPSGNSNATTVDVTVGGTDITQYKYVFTTQSTACTSCSLTYSNWTPVATHITGNPGADGNVRLCVKGGDDAANVAPVTTADWTKITAPPTITSVTLSDKTTLSTTMTNVQSVNAVGVGSATASQFCFKTANSTPAPGDSCWGATLQQILLTTVGTSNTIYAWVRDALGNIQTTPTTAAITWTNYCDSGTMDGTCVVSTARTIPNGAKLGGVGSLIVQAGGSFSMSATQTATLTFGGNITIENGGAINGNYTITAVNLDVQTGGSLSANAMGFAGGVATGGSGSGGGTLGYAGGGGSHAGFGGTAANGTGSIFYGLGSTVVYGSQTQPTTYGSGGAANTWLGGAGSAGGGALKISVSGTLTVNGILSANGGDIGVNSPSGAGAGGSLWIIAGDFAGSGTISVNGGKNYGYSGTVGGSGGGGRIAVYTAAHMFHGTFSVASGLNGNGGSNLFRGTSGTLYVDSSVGICDTGSLATTCTISSFVTLSSSYSIAGAGN